MVNPHCFLVFFAGWGHNNKLHYVVGLQHTRDYWRRNSAEGRRVPLCWYDLVCCWHVEWMEKANDGKNAMKWWKRGGYGAFENVWKFRVKLLCFLFSLLVPWARFFFSTNAISGNNAKKVEKISFWCYLQNL